MKLMAENSAYAPIYTQDVRILGRLRGIIRKVAPGAQKKRAELARETKKRRLRGSLAKR